MSLFVENQSERIALIGSSMSGKTYYLCTEIVPCFQYIHYFGPSYNLPPIEECMNKRALIEHHESLDDIGDLMTIAKKEFDLGNLLPPQLIILDDVIDPQFIKTRLFMSLMSTGRHYNLSVVIIAHTPNLVISPYVKKQLTAIVLCDYAPTAGFKELIEEYYKPMLQNDLAVSHTDRELTKLANNNLASIFKYRYGKLILRPLDSTWSVDFPANKKEKGSAYKDTPVCSINIIRRSATRDKAFLESTKGNVSDSDTE